MTILPFLSGHFFAVIHLNIRKVAVFIQLFAKKPLKISVSIGSYLKHNSVDAKEQNFHWWGHSRSLGTPCPPVRSLPTALLGHAATVRKTWILLPTTTKPVEIPRPQLCDSFRVGKKGGKTAGSAGKYQNRLNPAQRWVTEG